MAKDKKNTPKKVCCEKFRKKGKYCKRCPVLLTPNARIVYKSERKQAAKKAGKAN